jgi:hypothetical protein
VRVSRLRRCRGRRRSAHGADVDVEGLELLAHAVHVDLDRIAAHVLAPAEQPVDELLLRHHASLARQQQLEHAELARLELGQVEGLGEVIVGAFVEPGRARSSTSRS